MVLLAACDGELLESDPPAEVGGKADQAASSCESGTLVVEGDLDGDATWNVCDVELVGRVRILEGSSLRIAPGVRVRGSGALEIDGDLDARGTLDAPIRFSAVQAGARRWEGLVLRGRASLGMVEIRDAREFAIRVEPRDGGPVPVVEIDGAVIDTGRSRAATYLDGGYPARVGLLASRADVTVRRSLVRGFVTGISLDRMTSFLAEDSVIRDNGTGVAVDGEGKDPTCGWVLQDEPDPPPPMPRPGIDPELVRCDILMNEVGARLSSSERFFVSESNVVANLGPGLVLANILLDRETALVRNNIYGNTTGDRYQLPVRTQIELWHTGGDGLPIEDSYFGEPLVTAGGKPIQGSGLYATNHGHVQNGCYGPIEISEAPQPLEVGPELAGAPQAVRDAALPRDRERFATGWPFRHGNSSQPTYSWIFLPALPAGTEQIVIRATVTSGVPHPGTALTLHAPGWGAGLVSPVDPKFPSGKHEYVVTLSSAQRATPAGWWALSLNRTDSMWWWSRQIDTWEIELAGPHGAAE